MDPALVEDAKDDVHRQDRPQDEERLLVERGLEKLGCALEAALDRARHADLVHGSADGLLGVGQCLAGREVEGKRRGHELRLVVDVQGRVGRLETGEGHQRHALARRRHDEDVAEGFGAHRALGVHLHHETILVERLVDRRHGQLAEGVVERAIGEIDRDAIRGHLVTIIGDVGLETAVLGVGIDVGEFGQTGQGGLNLRHPLVKRRKFLGLHGVLVHRGTGSSSDADILCRHQHEAGAGDSRRPES